jgi:hypothetical protein
MAITNGYCTLQELKDRLWDSSLTSGSSTEDASMEAVIEAVSRQIDNYCGRHFFTQTDIRYYTAADTYSVDIDDLVSVSSVQSDNNYDRTYAYTWRSTDYDLLPYTAGSGYSPFVPYQWLEVAPQNMTGGSLAFPLCRKGVKVSGVFGYPKDATSGSMQSPLPVHEACILQASRIYKRKDAPFGVAGTSETGTLQLISKIDPDVKMLLDPYVKKTL